MTVRIRSVAVFVVAALLMVTVAGGGIARAQLETGESYWGEHMLNGIASLWPAVVIAVCVGVLAGAVVGFYEIDRGSLVFLLGVSGFLAYRFYWQPAHAAPARPASSP